MAQLGQTFDSDQHEDVGDFEAFPAGIYQGVISNSEIKLTKKKDGQILVLEHTVIEGEWKGRKVWTNLNIQNPNPQTVEIAQKTLATLCRAIGKKVIADTVELHGIPMQMKVKIIPAQGDYPKKNGIVSYKAVGEEWGRGSTPSPKTQPQVQETTPANNYEEPDSVPWE